MFWLYSNFPMFWLYLYLYHKYRLCIENWDKTDDTSKSSCSRLPQPRSTPLPPSVSDVVRVRAPWARWEPAAAGAANMHAKICNNKFTLYLIR